MTKKGDKMTDEIYQLKVDGEVRGSGTFEECMDEICKMRMHGCWFQNINESVSITRVE